MQNTRCSSRVLWGTGVTMKGLWCHNGAKGPCEKMAGILIGKQSNNICTRVRDRTGIWFSPHYTMRWNLQGKWRPTGDRVRLAAWHQFYLVSQPGFTKWHQNNTAMFEVISCLIQRLVVFFIFLHVSFNASRVGLLSWIFCEPCETSRWNRPLLILLRKVA